MTACDFGAGECAAVDTTLLRFAQQPGHVHVCPTHERIDREYCDVVASAPMPMSVCPVCPSAAQGGPSFLAVATPTLLEDS